MSELVIIPFTPMLVRILLIRGNTPCPLSMHRGLPTMWVHQVLARGLSAHLGKPSRTAGCKIILIWKYSGPTQTSDRYCLPFYHLASKWNWHPYRQFSKVASQADPSFWPRKVKRGKGVRNCDEAVTRYMLLCMGCISTINIRARTVQ